MLYRLLNWFFELRFYAPCQLLAARVQFVSARGFKLERTNLVPVPTRIFERYVMAPCMLSVCIVSSSLLVNAALSKPADAKPIGCFLWDDKRCPVCLPVWSRGGLQALVLCDTAPERDNLVGINFLDRANVRPVWDDNPIKRIDLGSHSLFLLLRAGGTHAVVSLVAYYDRFWNCIEIHRIYFVFFHAPLLRHDLSTHALPTQ